MADYSPAGQAGLATKIQGLREAKAAFQALPERMRERLNDATDITLREVVRLAKAQIVASPSIQTRTLLNAIGYTLNRNSGKGKAGIANVTTTITMGGNKFKVKGNVMAGPSGGAAGGVVKRPTHYGHMVEFGTRNMPAEPFMIPALEKEEAPYLDRCKRAGSLVEQDLAAIGMRNL